MDRADVTDSSNSGDIRDANEVQVAKGLGFDTFLRRDKSSSIYTTPNPSSSSQVEELHIFEAPSPLQKWFLKQVIWPKLRKSPNFDRELSRDEHRCFIFRQGYVKPPVEDTGQLDAAAIGKQTFRQHMDPRCAPLFQDEPFPWNFRSKAPESGPTKPASHIDEHDIGAKTETSPRRRRRPRVLPRDRDQNMILNWARMLAEEVHLDILNRVTPPGGKFLLKFVHPERAPPIHGHDTLQSMIQKQVVWAERLQRMVEQLPEAFQKQKDLRDQAWLEGTPWIQRWFGENASPDNDESRDPYLRWGRAMKWVTDWSFDVFENEPVLNWDMTRWLLCIAGNAAIHQWSLDEEEKQLGQAARPDAILIRMVKTQTRWELTKGMGPLLVQMQETAEAEVSDWKSLG